MTAWRAIGGALIVAGVVTHAIARRPAASLQSSEARRTSLPTRAEPAS